MPNIDSKPTFPRKLDSRDMSIGELQIRGGHEINLLLVSRKEQTEEWKKALSDYGLPNRQVLLALVCQRVARMGEIQVFATEPSSDRRVLALDHVLFGSGPAEKVDPKSTPYGGMAKWLEVAFGDRERVKAMLMEVRREILDAMNINQAGGV